MRPDTNKITTSSTYICHLFQVICILLFLFWGVSILIVKSHLLHVSFTARQQQIMNNKWLIEQCKESEFYHNMKHHATLCDDIELQNRDSIWLHALRDVLDNSSVCGPVHCDALFAASLSYMIDHLPLLIAFVIVISVMVLIFCVPWYSQKDRLRNAHIRDLEDDWQCRPMIADYQYQIK